MTDDNNFDDFEKIDAGSSSTYPVQAGSIRKGDHIIVKTRPCKVTNIAVSKTGKHGHSKCHFTCIDIFTDKKCEELCPSSHNINVPRILRRDYQLLNIDDGFLSLIDDTGTIKDDLKLPNDNKLSLNIIKSFEDGLDINISTISAVKEEMVKSFNIIS